MAKFKCPVCQTKGKIGAITQVETDKKFIAKQWYYDEKGLIHTLLVCKECGAFCDAKFTFVGVLFGKPYKAVGVIEKETIENIINSSLVEREVYQVDDEALRELSIKEYTFSYILEHGVKYNLRIYIPGEI